MACEIEAKLRYESHEDLRKALRVAGAASAKRFQQLDTYFDDAAGSLTARHSALRLRRQTDMNDGSRCAALTFKGPPEQSEFKRRTEISIEVPNPQAAEELLASLGFRKILRLEKRREVWQVGPCEVALDELPLIGRYVEIEGPDEEAIAGVQSMLGLAGLEHVRRSYAAIVAEEIARRCPGVNEVVFERGL